MPQVTIATGSYVSATLKSSDLLDPFMDLLKQLSPATHAQVSKDFESVIAAIRRSVDGDPLEPDEEGLASDLLSEVATHINGRLPDAYYFGTTEGDGSDFGVWLTPADDEWMRMELAAALDIDISELDDFEVPATLTFESD